MNLHLARLEKTVTQLADGRDLIYYDERRAPVRPPDGRSLDEVAARTELRRDPLLNEWVVIATQRQGRTHLPPAHECPLCPSVGNRHTEIPAADYDVVVLENRFPSLTPSGEGSALPQELFASAPGNGRCEVVCYTSDHLSSLRRLPTSRLRTVIDVWSDRTRDLAELPGVAQVFVFENSGEEIGVTLNHPHGQIYAYPFVAPRLGRKLESAELHERQTGECLFCAILCFESDQQERIVESTEHWLAFVPRASRWPYEVHLYPKRHVPDLPGLSDAERDDLAPTLKRIMKRFDGLFEGPVPYMATWQQAPLRERRALSHLHLEVFSPKRAPDKLKFLAGSESGAGVFINDVRPEEAARRLRAAL